MKIAIATKNQGKIREIKDLLDWAGVEFLTINDAADWPDVEETGATFRENAVIKAVTVADFFKCPAISDDSGLEVDPLGGRPGVESARFAGPDATDKDNVAKVIAELKRISGEKDGGCAPDFPARFVCEAALADADGEFITTRGVCEGNVVLNPKGTGGFGYDPVFVPRGYDKTMAELDPGEKNRLSHRGRAFRSIKGHLEWLTS